MIVLRRIRTSANSGVKIGVPLSGVMDGSNKVFTVPDEYVSGRITVQYEGQVLHSSDDFNETGPKQITLKYIAPHADSVLRANYEIK